MKAIAPFIVIVSALLLGAISIGPIIPIATGQVDQRAPLTAYNPVSKKFLVCWLDGQVTNVKGRFVGLDGSQSPAFPLATLANHSQIVDHPSIAYNSKENTFLLALGDETALYTRVIRGDGTPAGPIKRLAPFRPGYGSLVLRYLSLRNEYLLGVVDSNKLLRLRSDGASIATTFTFPEASNTTYPSKLSILANSSDQNYYLFWFGPLRFQALAGDGTPLGPNSAVLPPRMESHNDYPSVVFNPRTNRILLLYQVQPTGNGVAQSGLYTVILNLQGQRVSQPVQIALVAMNAIIG